ncbi:MAG: hypothetical protein NVSMB5_05700 [Candidatus Velthaea sp.]
MVVAVVAVLLLAESDALVLDDVLLADLLASLFADLLDELLAFELLFDVADLSLLAVDVELSAVTLLSSFEAVESADFVAEADAFDALSLAFELVASFLLDFEAAKSRFALMLLFALADFESVSLVGVSLVLTVVVLELLDTNAPFTEELAVEAASLALDELPDAFEVALFAAVDAESDAEAVLRLDVKLELLVFAVLLSLFAVDALLAFFAEADAAVSLELLEELLVLAELSVLLFELFDEALALESVVVVFELVSVKVGP